MDKITFIPSKPYCINSKSVTPHRNFYHPTQGAHEIYYKHRIYIENIY